MAVGYPLKTTYADGDVYSASDVNDTNGTINLAVGTTPSTATQMAGRNKIINGDFRFNQRAFTSNTADGTYNFDRWAQANGGTSGTLTVTPQTFTAGTAPVTGYEAINYVQCVTAAGANTNTYAQYLQKIEDVRTFANQTVVISFWAKATSGTPKIAVELRQNFGTGGSPSAEVNTYAGNVTLSTSWARYSVSVAVPSISGKTLGTTANTSFFSVILWLSAGSDFNSRTGSIGLQNNTFQMWGVQAENGSVATPFQTATGTIQGELAACQRYYYRIAAGQNYYRYAHGMNTSTTQSGFVIPLKTSMRVIPSFATSGTIESLQGGASLGLNAPVLSSDGNSTETAYIVTTVVAATSGYAVQLRSSNNTTSYLEFSAEL